MQPPQPPYGQPRFQQPQSQQPRSQQPQVQQAGFPQPQVQQPGFPQPGYGPPTGLVAPLGEPQRVPGGLRVGVLVVLGLLLAVTAGFGGYEVAFFGGNKLQVILWFLPAILVMLGMGFVWQDTVWSVRCDGRVLEGGGLLGRQGIDLARLTAVGSTANARATQLVLRDDVAGLTVDAKALHKAGPAVVDAVGRAVWAGQEQGRYVVSKGAAAVWGMPTRPDAPANGRTGATPRGLALVGLLTVGVVVGVVLQLS